MGMGFDVEAVMEEGGRVLLTGLPYEAGRKIRVHTESEEEANARVGGGHIDELDRLAQYLHAKYPNAPLLSDEAISRESIYEDDGL